MDDVMVVETGRDEVAADTITAPRRTGLRDERPDPQWIRGRCPECGDDLVSNLYYIGGKGYLLRWECWSSLGESPACGYYKVL